jgi:cell division protein FtsL
MKVRSLEIVIAVVLAVAVVVSGLWLVEAKHEARQLFAELEELKREQDRLQVDWGRLQIEESTFGTQSRIESLALEEIDLGMPRNDQIVVVTGPPK